MAYGVNQRQSYFKRPTKEEQAEDGAQKKSVQFEMQASRNPQANTHA